MGSSGQDPQVTRVSHLAHQTFWKCGCVGNVGVHVVRSSGSSRNVRCWGSCWERMFHGHRGAVMGAHVVRLGVLRMLGICCRLWMRGSACGTASWWCLYGPKISNRKCECFGMGALKSPANIKWLSAETLVHPGQVIARKLFRPPGQVRPVDHRLQRSWLAFGVV